MAKSLRAGAAALQDLIRRLGAKADVDLEEAYEAAGIEDGDARDYRAMAAMVMRDLEENLHHEDPAHREGYLRALTDLLSITADGCGPGNDWDPIADTETAYMAPQSAADLLSRAAAAPGRAAG
jgi:hypothetical protein